MTAAATHTLVIEKEFPYPPEKLWRALTEGALIKEWLMDNDFHPSVGHQFNFRATPVANWNGVIDSKVLIVEPNRKLAYSWGSMGLETIVTWTIVATAGGTRLRMEQSGFRPDQEFAYKGANYGWQKFISNLGRVVAGLQ